MGEKEAEFVGKEKEGRKEKRTAERIVAEGSIGRKSIVRVINSLCLTSFWYSELSVIVLIGIIRLKKYPYWKNFMKRIMRSTCSKRTHLSKLSPSALSCLYKVTLFSLLTRFLSEVTNTLTNASTGSGKNDIKLTMELKASIIS